MRKSKKFEKNYNMKTRTQKVIMVAMFSYLACVATMLIKIL